MSRFHNYLILSKINLYSDSYDAEVSDSIRSMAISNSLYHCYAYYNLDLHNLFHHLGVFADTVGYMSLNLIQTHEMSLTLVYVSDCSLFSYHLNLHDHGSHRAFAIADVHAHHATYNLLAYPCSPRNPLKDFYVHYSGHFYHGLFPTTDRTLAQGRMVES